VTFRGVAKRAGLNPYEYNQANIREQCSWTHTDDHEGATAKAIGLVRGVIGRTRESAPLEPIVVETTQKALVIGGGIAGLRAAVGLADVDSASSSSSARRSWAAGSAASARSSRTTATAAS